MKREETNFWSQEMVDVLDILGYVLEDPTTLARVIEYMGEHCRDVTHNVNNDMLILVREAGATEEQLARWKEGSGIHSTELGRQLTKMLGSKRAEKGRAKGGEVRCRGMSETEGALWGIVRELLLSRQARGRLVWYMEYAGEHLPEEFNRKLARIYINQGGRPREIEEWLKSVGIVFFDLTP